MDTDVLVLAIAAAAKHEFKRIFVHFGVGDHKKILKCHSICRNMGHEKAKALPVFHAFTGCDTVSSFKSIGKKTAWERWNAFDEVTDAFADLSTGPDDIDSDTEQLLERFVILMYDKTSAATSINQLRKDLFTKGRSIDKIPPTAGALIQHDRRAAYQGGHSWGSAAKKGQQLPDAEKWGWSKDKEGWYTPLWTLDPIAS